MDATSKSALWAQLSASLTMLENAIRACPDALWGAKREPPFWYLAYHTLFYLDLYLSPSTEGFVPPAPFTLDELDPSGVMPGRVYAKQELLDYLEHGRVKARARVAALNADTAAAPCDYRWIQLSPFEALLYNMRHVQHHTAQLNLILRQMDEAVPGWLARGSKVGKLAPDW